MFNLSGSCGVLSRAAVPLPPPPVVLEGSQCLASLPTRGGSVCKVLAVLIGTRWHLVASVLISFMNNDVEHVMGLM